MTVRRMSVALSLVASLVAACSKSGDEKAKGPALACPGATGLHAHPQEDVVVDGTQFWSEAATAWAWTVTGGACDQLLYATAATTTFTVSGTETSELVFHPTLPGDYSVHLEVATDGGPLACDFPVRVRSDGVRVALCWDTTGDTDLDLHLHRSGSTDPWFSANDDCFYGNCLCSVSSGFAYWGYSSFPLAACEATRDAACWGANGSCRNPRIELDNIDTAGLPEIIAVDNPNVGDSLRVMAHYYRGSVTTHPIVSVFCGEAGEVATFGADPDPVGGFASGGGGNGLGPMWKVADVTWNGAEGCSVAQLHPTGTDTGYRVEVTDTSY